MYKTKLKQFKATTQNIILLLSQMVGRKKNIYQRTDDARNLMLHEPCFFFFRKYMNHATVGTSSLM